LELKVTDKISVGVEVEWSPDVINSDTQEKDKRLWFLNGLPDKPDKGYHKIGYDIDMDIILVSANVIFRF